MRIEEKDLIEIFEEKLGAMVQDLKKEDDKIEVIKQYLIQMCEIEEIEEDVFEIEYFEVPEARKNDLLKTLTNGLITKED